MNTLQRNLNHLTQQGIGDVYSIYISSQVIKLRCMASFRKLLDEARAFNSSMLNEVKRGSSGEVWPYIVPLPTPSQYTVLSSLFSSKASLDIMRKIRLEGKMYHGELIAQLPYSNKTVTESLKRMVSNGLLEEGMEKSQVNGKARWLKWYKLTKLGRWIKLLIIPPSQLPKERIKELVNELFQLYLNSVIELYRKNNISLQELKNVFEKACREKS